MSRNSANVLQFPNHPSQPNSEPSDDFYTDEINRTRKVRNFAFICAGFFALAASISAYAGSIPWTVLFSVFTAISVFIAFAVELLLIAAIQTEASVETMYLIESMEDRQRRYDEVIADLQEQQALNAELLSRRTKPPTYH